MGKLLPILLALVGLGAGIGAGLALRPEPQVDVAEGECPCDCEALAAELAAIAGDSTESGEEGAPTSDFVKMNNQFVIPVVKGASVSALVVLTLSLEVKVGQSEAVYQREPKLRDKFLQVLFDHANSGGFDGAFTAGPNMSSLRTALLEVARASLSNNVIDVLITDMARQDI